MRVSVLLTLLVLLNGSSETGGEPTFKGKSVKDWYQKLKLAKGVLNADAMYALAKLGTPAAQYLVSQLSVEEPEYTTRHPAVTALAYMGYVGAEGTDLVFKALENPDEKIQFRAAVACQDMGWKGYPAVARLTSLLASRTASAEVRRKCCIALESILLDWHGTFSYVGEFKPEAFPADGKQLMAAACVALLAIEEASRDADGEVAFVARAAMVAIRQHGAKVAG